MNWIKPLTIVEYVFIGIFLLVYVVYFIRSYIIATRLGTSARSVAIKFFIRTAYLSLCILGLLGPSFGVSEIETQAAGKDVYFAFDVSRSMDAVDIEPTRLEKVKFELVKNLAALKSDRVGIVVFSSDAYVQVPLTFDKDLLKLYIQKLNSDLFTDSGTDLNSAFKLIQTKYHSVSAPARKAKVVILISDGEDFGELDPSVIQDLKRNRVSFLALGVGTPQGGKIKMGYDYKKDKEGNVVVSKLNADYLKRLARAFGGKYFQLSNRVNDVPALLKEVSQLNNNWVDTRKMTVANNKYFYFVFLALVLMIIDILVTIRTIKL
ncbi:VWA domain-containing protein [Emticicia sp. 21SJ11W-3]|uniref:vWA domain-containing protein n=1 Tax=Emticicia sp. 21SJ11W-3 TaxID=2916755 RepID=UPI0020A0D37D|nr:VWA domain-containing protein [Emticicia sp. 21SJ11W-3]UTA70124.1 VWA domain-containing protein [Emticicia sp. 21SJ11W-3]